MKDFKQIFENHPDIDVIYQATDTLTFTNKNKAEAYQNGLNQKEDKPGKLVMHERSDYIKVAKKVASEAKSADEKK